MTEQYAKALVECGYAIRYVETHEFIDGFMVPSSFMVFECELEPSSQPVDPFADTLEGRRQADAIAGWFFNKHRGMWDSIQFMKRDEPYNNHEHLCKQLRTGFKQLEEK